MTLTQPSAEPKSEPEVEPHPDPALGAMAARLGHPLRTRSEIAPVASPMRRGVDGAVRIVETLDGTRSFVLKVWHRDLPDPVDHQTVFEMSRRAAEAGVAPRVLGFLPDEKAILFEHLGPGWTTARLDALGQAPVFERLVEAKTRLHRLDPFPRDRDVFAEIDALALAARTAGAIIPHDAAPLLAFAARAGAAIAASGVDRVPGHGDGTVSNVMLGPDGALRLVDFDAAGNLDPLYDIAILLNEMFEPGDRRRDAALEAAAGVADQRSLARAALYAIADDIKWALWGLTLDATSPRRAAEFLKFGQWRWHRARMALALADPEEAIGHV